MKYFKKEWIAKKNTWFEGYAIGVPSTNNAIEATNAQIKRSGTLRERLPLGRFLKTTAEICHNWSRDRNPNYKNTKVVVNEPTIPMETWLKAYQLVNEKRQISVSDDETVWVFESKNPPPNDSLEGFDRDVRIMMSNWKVEVKDPWKTSFCTCPTFLKNHQCHHIAAMGIISKKALNDENAARAKAIFLERKKKRGRPRKATSAIIVD